MFLYEADGNGASASTSKTKIPKEKFDLCFNEELAPFILIG